MDLPQFVSNLIVYGWVLPSILLTVHTLLTIVYILFTETGQSVPMLISVSYLLHPTEPFGRRIFEKPSVGETLFYLGGGLIPIVSLALLLIYVITLFIQLVVCSEDLDAF